MGSVQQNVISYRGNPLDPHTLGSLLKRHAQAADVKKVFTPHVWRHTCATHLVQNHANLRHVRTFWATVPWPPPSVTSASPLRT